MIKIPFNNNITLILLYFKIRIKKCDFLIYYVFKNPKILLVFLFFLKYKNYVVQL